MQANRSEQDRHDVIDAVLDDHVAHFESPVDEAPLIVDAQDTRDETTIGEIVDSIRNLVTT